MRLCVGVKDVGEMEGRDGEDEGSAPPPWCGTWRERRSLEGQRQGEWRQRRSVRPWGGVPGCTELHR